MGPARNVYPRPRRHGGGRSEGYAARRAAGGTSTQYAAEWSDAAAHAVFVALHSGRLRTGYEICKHTEGVLRETAAGIERFASRDCLGLCAADRALVVDIMAVHARRVEEAETREARVRRVRAFLKPLRERARARGTVGVLDTGPSCPGLAGTFHKWLSPRPELERQRVMLEGGRTQTGLAAWPREWQTGWGVVCYERAAGRLLVELAGGSLVEERLVRSVIRTDYLPTAVASAADHYVTLVGPEGQARYMTVEEVARGFGLAADSSLMATLAAPDVLTPVQEVGCLGRAVHVGIARLLVRTLAARGMITAGLAYGSAYSGVDGVAAALEAEMGDQWTYEFASDRLPYVRAALLHAWGGRGLRAARCREDASGAAATGEEAVGLWAITPSCEAFSRRNHDRSRDAQRACLGEIWRSLGYARAASPSVILVENVAEPEVVEPLTGLLQRLEGYSVETLVLDPRVVLGEPMARERRFWVLRRAEPGHAVRGRVGSDPDAGEAHEQSGACH